MTAWKRLSRKTLSEPIFSNNRTKERVPFRAPFLGPFSAQILRTTEKMSPAAFRKNKYFVNIDKSLLKTL